jgi:predicted GTPase
VSFDLIMKEEAPTKNKVSFDRIGVWLDLLSQANKVTPPVVLVVNKTDLEANLVARQEEITQEYGTWFDGIFFVSALTGHGVEVMFNHVAEVGYHFTRQANEAVAGPVVLGGSGAAKKSGCC